MAARATWKGFLKVSLVNIPIKVFPATESSGTISFNQLHGECQTRIQQKRWCPTCNKEVANTELVEGLRVREGPLRRHVRRGHRKGAPDLDARHRPRAVRRCGRARSDVRGSHLLPGARRPGGGRCLRRVPAKG